MESAREDMLGILRQRLGVWESAWRGSGEGCDQVRSNQSASNQSGAAGVWKALFPRQRILTRGLIEWFEDRLGGGAGSVALLMAQQQYLARRGERADRWLVIVDAEGTLNPSALVRYGISLRRVIVIRTRGHRDVIWAWEQALRSSAVAVTWGRLGDLDPKEFRRLQLAAEQGRTVGMLIRSSRWRSAPSWSELGFLVRPEPSLAQGNFAQAQESLGEAPPSLGQKNFEQAQSRAPWSQRQWYVQTVRSRSGSLGAASLGDMSLKGTTLKGTTLGTGSLRVRWPSS